jgi:hypothetical protein
VSVAEALQSRQSKDLIVPECKDGPTWGGGHRRLDYWVLRRSWSNPAMIGYEVKSGRADFLADQKWQTYLPLCNELWFIAETKDAIAAKELPESVGLLRLAGSRLITVRRAAWRELTVPPDALMTYVLMCRTRIEKEHMTGDGGQTAYWREWLERREEDQRVGYDVSKRLRQRYEQDVERERARNDSLQEQVRSLTAIRDALDARGVRWDRWTQAEEIVDEIMAPKWNRREVEHVRDTLTKLLDGSETS